MFGGAFIASESVIVTPSDTDNIPNGPWLGFYLPVAGNMKFKNGVGNDVGPIAMLAGYHGQGILRVYATGTDNALVIQALK